VGGPGVKETNERAEAENERYKEVLEKIKAAKKELDDAIAMDHRYDNIGDQVFEAHSLLNGALDKCEVQSDERHNG
jgi:hypothetical protein